METLFKIAQFGESIHLFFIFIPILLATIIIPAIRYNRPVNRWKYKFISWKEVIKDIKMDAECSLPMAN